MKGGLLRHPLQQRRHRVTALACASKRRTGSVEDRSLRHQTWYLHHPQAIMVVVFLHLVPKQKLKKLRLRRRKMKMKMKMKMKNKRKKKGLELFQEHELDGKNRVIHRAKRQSNRFRMR